MELELKTISKFDEKIERIKEELFYFFDSVEAVKWDIEYGKKALRAFAKVLRMRVSSKGDWDNIVAITGDEGVGKSTAAIQLGKLLDKKFSIKRNELITPDVKVLEYKLTKELPKGSVLICDEAIKILYKLGWSSKSQIFLNKLYALARQERKTTILCMPRFKDFNEYFRNHRIKFWIHLVARGIGMLFVRDWNPFTDDPWWMKENQKLIENAIKARKFTETNLDFKVNLLKRCKNFVALLYFEKLDEETEKEYIELIGKRKIELIEEEEKKESKKIKEMKEKVAKLINYLFYEKRVSKKEIKNLLGTSDNFIREIVKSDPRYQEYKEKSKKKISFLEKLRRLNINKL